MITIYRYTKRRNIKNTKTGSFDQSTAWQDKAEGAKPIPKKIAECEQVIRDSFHNSSDLIIRTFPTHQGNVMIAFIDGLVDRGLVDRDIITKLKSERFNGDIGITINSFYRTVTDIDSCVSELVNGNTAIFTDNSKQVVITELKKWGMREVEEPDAESVTRGPKEGFIEDITTNTAMLRRKLKNPNLVFEQYIFGKQSNTVVELAYIEGIVNKDVLAKIKDRLSKIDTDIILESGYIEQYIEENTFSPVSGIGLTQKPDIVAAKIVEGRVAVFVDGTPHVLTIPELFIENIQASEDYYNRTLFACLLRVLRLLSLFISIILPGLAVAIIVYNQEMMPSVFLTSYMSSTQKTPMPAAAEAFFLIIMFEFLREAGTRLPKTVGSAITIVGSLIIGDAAVNAGIVGAPMVIVIALTAVSSFIVPNLTEFIILYRFFFLFFGSTMGIIGVGAGFVIMMTQVMSVKSFGTFIVPTYKDTDMEDKTMRFPLWAIKFRPSMIAKQNFKSKNM